MLILEVPQSHSFLIPLNRRKTKVGIFSIKKIPTALKNLHPKLIRSHVKALQSKLVKFTQLRRIPSIMRVRHQKVHNKSKISIDSNGQREVYSKLKTL